MVYRVPIRYEMARTQCMLNGEAVWAAVEETVFTVGIRHKVRITLFDYGNTTDHIKLEHFMWIQNQWQHTYAHTCIMTPLLDYLRNYLFKDLRRELPDNRTEEKQRLLILKAMQELM